MLGATFRSSNEISLETFIEYLDGTFTFFKNPQNSFSFFERVMHDMGSSIPFTELAHACPWSLVFLSVLSNVPRKLLCTFISTCITSIE
jgi:hypothetical protein